MNPNPLEIIGNLTAGKNLFLEVGAIVFWLSVFLMACQANSDSPKTRAKPSADAVKEQKENRGNLTGEEPYFFIRQYKVIGAKHLPKVEVEKAIYPYLGPYRTSEDIQKACSSLEKAYLAEGYQTVMVQGQPRPDRKGVIMIRVSEIEVGRLRVRNSRYFDLESIKEDAPSLAEGRFPNINEISRDLTALNRYSDRRITPSFNAGKEPGTVDVDLTVKDTFPLHGSTEINNRYSADTTPLRLNTSLSYGNLWQMGHTVGMSYQTSPLDFKEVEAFSAYYLAPVLDVKGLNLMLQGSKQTSSVSTLGNVNTLGGGESVGVRAMMSLPGKKGFYHSVTLGVDLKQSEQVISQDETGTTQTPVTYFPWSANYRASWLGEGSVTDFNGGFTFNSKGLGNDTYNFNERRQGADVNFLYFRGDISHTRDLPWGFQLFSKVQGQASSGRLINSEQFSGGGLDTARGYLESLHAGDNGIFATMEMRSPNLGSYLCEEINDWRFFVFTDAGRVALSKALPGEISSVDMASWGFGNRIHLFDRVNGELLCGIPLTYGSQFQGPLYLMTFRLGCNF